MELVECDKLIDAVSERVPSVDSCCLKDIDFLQKGAFGHVRKVSVKGSHLRLQQTDYQHPILFAAKHTNLNCNDPEEATWQLANEASILSTLNHENIIKLRAVCSGKFSEALENDPRGYFLLFDLLDETLQDRLNRWRHERRTAPHLCSNIYKKMTRRLSFVESATKSTERRNKILKRADRASVDGIARGLAYLHSKRILWGDLKPANIGYYRNSDGSWTVKLIDFGMSRRIEDWTPGDCCGSPAYMAPEVMDGIELTLNADIFSFGVVLSEVCSLLKPYEKHNEKHKKKKDFDDLENTIHCPEIRTLVNECWEQPEDRPSSTEVAIRLDSILKPLRYKNYSCALDSTTRSVSTKTALDSTCFSCEDQDPDLVSAPF